MGTVKTLAGIGYLLLLIPVWRMADNRDRSVKTWVWFSVFCTPLVGMVMLYFLGDSSEIKKRRRKIIEEEALRLAVREKLKESDGEDR